MKSQCITGIDYVSKNYTSKDRILLINPPVIETRYEWVRWNQPLDLLKLSNFLKKEFGCQVKLFDFMFPVNSKVSRTLNRSEPELEINGHTYPLWRWGKNYEGFSRWLDNLLPRWHPTEIWITSLTSYWWKGISNTTAWMKNKLPDARVVLYGQYPTLETSHALRYSFADVIITKKIDLTNNFADLGLYEEYKPAFCALDVHAGNWSQEITEKLKMGISDFVFFNDDILHEAPDYLLPQLKVLQKQISRIASTRLLRFHALCGLYPALFTERIAKEMKEASFVELHFEYQTDGEELNLDAYQQAKRSYEQAGFKLKPEHFTGFVNIGLSNDDLERIIRHTMNLLEIFGSVILKPYTPTPGSDTYERYKQALETERIERLSPHFFPFSKVNGITHAEYDELYTLVASLNHKVRNKAFDHFPGTLGYEMIKTSLEREVWRLGYEKGTAD